jgi:hypothetical protein
VRSCCSIFVRRISRLSFLLFFSLWFRSNSIAELSKQCRQNSGESLKEKRSWSTHPDLMSLFCVDSALATIRFLNNHLFQYASTRSFLAWVRRAQSLMLSVAPESVNHCTIKSSVRDSAIPARTSNMLRGVTIYPVTGSTI